jgi:dTDP-4-amino-4,6-dideoxygalactose transaminase
LNYVEQNLDARKNIANHYDENLRNLRVTKPLWNQNSFNNYSYYPLIFESEELLIKCMAYLSDRQIFTRRYFYPSLASSVPYLEDQILNVTDDVSKRVLCLPLYTDLTLEEVEMICRLMLRVQNN